MSRLSKTFASWDRALAGDWMSSPDEPIPTPEPVTLDLGPIETKVKGLQQRHDELLTALAAQDERHRMLDETLRQITEVSSSPVDVIERDERGRIKSLRKAGKVLTVERDKDGRAARLV